MRYLVLKPCVLGKGLVVTLGHEDGIVPEPTLSLRLLGDRTSYPTLKYLLAALGHEPHHAREGRPAIPHALQEAQYPFIADGPLGIAGVDPGEALQRVYEEPG